MALRDWFRKRTPLQLALDRGVQPGADLSDEIRGLGEVRVESRADAEAICRTLYLLAEAPSPVGGESALHALIGLFQDIAGPDCPAFTVMVHDGIPRLANLIRKCIFEKSRWDDDDLMFALKILAMYGTPDGTEVVIDAARKPLKPDGYMWSVILGAYKKDHPQRERLLSALREPLPTKFLAVALLDSANAGLIEGADEPHPFDSPAGKERLESWLTDPDPDHSSYAISATAALPFISGPERDQLLALALDHAVVDVQLEAAWAAARLGREAGIQVLARYCLVVDQSDRARRYLTELGREDAIPADATDPDFQARAEFALWLAHPNELGRAPDEVTIIDQRELNWPPERTPKPFWLVKYCVRDTTGLKDDDVGVGLVGSVTFSLFSYKLEERPPEDGYAIHCYWEMQHRDLISEIEVEEDSTEYDRLLADYRAGSIVAERITRIAELSPELKYPQRLVAIARAKENDSTGWLVLDGARTRFYSHRELPDVSFETTVLGVHVGRQLLGFTDEPDRRKYLRGDRSGRSPQELIEAFDRLLNQARQDSLQAKKWLGNNSPLASAFPEYVQAKVTVEGVLQAVASASAYELLLEAAKPADPSVRDELFDTFSPLGKNLEAYTDALVVLKRQDKLPALVEMFRPHWDHNYGYGKLGAIAFRAGHDSLAEPFFLKLLGPSDKGWCRSEHVGMLAEIWCRQGRQDEARTLLIEAMRGVLDESRSATGSDRQFYEEWFQNQRTAFLRLFPKEGEAALSRLKFPSSTLPGTQ
jgi:hypothetical protein